MTLAKHGREVPLDFDGVANASRPISGRYDHLADNFTDRLGGLEIALLHRRPDRLRQVRNLAVVELQRSRNKLDDVLSGGRIHQLLFDLALFLRQLGRALQIEFIVANALTEPRGVASTLGNDVGQTLFQRAPLAIARTFKPLALFVVLTQVFRQDVRLLQLLAQVAEHGILDLVDIVA
ncbi:MAG: hypothetical protein M9895_04420 [Aquamicrobium sp.]|uniref:hypothetical protein n=1 Tax=Aquamicrobium sp. TaxID=1872579 RepID=UPI00349EEF2F|nr:hypothetical protein [Aquamicrobium sp.]MCO5157954.1 hypothetical protein [Aquamicrobium sp.]